MEKLIRWVPTTACCLTDFLFLLLYLGNMPEDWTINIIFWGLAVTGAAGCYFCARVGFMHEAVVLLNQPKLFPFILMYSCYFPFSALLAVAEMPVIWMCLLFILLVAFHTGWQYDRYWRFISRIMMLAVAISEMTLAAVLCGLGLTIAYIFS